MSEDLEAELGFVPAISETGADRDAVESGARRIARPPRSRWRRGAAGGMVLIAAVGSMAGFYALFASNSGADTSAASSAQIEQGHQLYDVSCITCHGANLQGISGRGPSLLGVGAAATYFQVSTGRMPAAGQAAEELRKQAKFTEDQTNALAAFVQAQGGGPTVPTYALRLTPDQIAAGDLAQGGQLFRLNCASCHGFSGKGAPLSAGKVAPSLNNSSDTQIATAMLSGPENMPVFSDNQLTPLQKAEIITYIQTLKKSADPGGNGLDRIGPVSEGLVIWVLGIGAMVATILWIGAKS